MVRWTAARIAAHGSIPPNGASVLAAIGMPARSSDASRHNRGCSSTGMSPQVVLAAFGDEVGLGDDGDPEVDQVGDHVVGDDRRVLDAIARVAPADRNAASATTS